MVHDCDYYECDTFAQDTGRSLAMTKHRLEAAKKKMADTCDELKARQEAADAKLAEQKAYPMQTCLGLEEKCCKICHASCGRGPRYGLDDECTRRYRHHRFYETFLMPFPHEKSAYLFCLASSERLLGTGFIQHDRFFRGRDVA